MGHIEEYKRKRELNVKQSYSVVKANTIIQQSRFCLTTQEQKIILYLISKIQPDDENFKMYDFSIQEFCKICQIDDINGKNYKNLKQTLKNFRDKSMWVEVEEGRETVLAWIDAATIDKNSGIVKVKIADMMKPYLLQLKERFTQYSLFYVLSMRSQYSMRLYELLKSYQYKGVCEFEIDDFKRKMGAEKYQRHADFKRFVLDTAMREIDTCADMRVLYELEKTGKRFTKIIFRIQPIEFPEYRQKHENINKRLNKKNIDGQVHMLEPKIDSKS